MHIKKSRKGIRALVSRMDLLKMPVLFWIRVQTWSTLFHRGALAQDALITFEAFLVLCFNLADNSIDGSDQLFKNLILHFWLIFLPVRRRQWHPTPVLLPGRSHGPRSLVGCSPWGCLESDATEWLHFHFSLSCIGEGSGNPLQYSWPGESQGRRSLVGCHLWGRTESDTTEAT